MRWAELELSFVNNIWCPVYVTSTHTSAHTAKCACCYVLQSFMSKIMFDNAALLHSMMQAVMLLSHGCDIGICLLYA